MPGVRIDRFLASTAIALLLSGAAGGALSEPKSGSIEAATGGGGATISTPAAPAAPTVTQPQAPAADQSSAQPAERVEPFGPAKTEGSAEQPAAAGTDTAASPAPSMPTSSPPAGAERSDAAAPPDQPPGTTAEPAAANAAPAETAEPPSGQAAEEPAAAPSAPAAPASAVAAPSTQPAAATGGGDEVPTVATVPPSAAPADDAGAAAPAVAASNPVAEQLRELAAGKFDRLLGGKRERTAFEAFYAAHDYAPVWITDGALNARAQTAIAYLGQVDADGLEPVDYPAPHLTAGADPAALAEAELRLSLSVATYARHAQVGRVHWSRVSADIYYEQKAPTPAEVLAAMTDAKDAKDVGEALAAYEPHGEGYLALKAKLAELRAGNATTDAPAIANGPVLKIGAQDERVPQLRTRLHLASGDGITYDRALAEAVKTFQQEHELKATGTLTPATVEALNGRQPSHPIDTVLANMERWRWMPHELGKSYVIVNLPDFTLRVIQGGHQVWMTKIVDGKPEMPTPIMSAEMKYITINPTWNVPPSIVAREYMPALQQDPTVLERMGLRVSTNPDGTVHISQPPGDANALGRVRFNFPNKFLVYQHDTPNKNLFAFDRRAFSHGCMRVQDPVKYAEVLLSIVRPGEGYTQDRIRRMFGESEADIQFPKYLPVHLTYQTAFVDEEGRLEFRDDVYGRDKVLIAILKSDERKVADTPIEHHENPIRREALAMPDQQNFFGTRSYYPGGGGNFFSRLFGAPEPPPPPQQRKRAAQRRQEIH
jgi:L,D-transpeptidase YcbB